MKIDHLAMWTKDLEGMKDFYIKYFRAVSNKKYWNENKELETYILRFDDGPRRTGDGFYESAVLDPEGNRIEITV